MDSNLEWTTSSPEELRSALLDDLPGALTSELEDALEDIGTRLVSKAREYAPVDRGRLRSSLSHEVQINGREMKVRYGSNVDQAAPMETGSDPFMPPYEELQGWAGRVLGDESLAYPVALSIADSGLDGYQYLEQALDEIEDWAHDRIQQAVNSAFSSAGFGA